MKYIIVVDKQSRTNPSSQKRETIIDIEELRRKGDVHDDFVIEKGIAKVYRRIGLTKYHVTYVLENELIEELGELKIKLFKGDNYLYIKDEYNNNMCAEYVIDNEFNERYVTYLKMESAIEETARQIKLYVGQVLEGYSDTETTKAMINIKADEIREEVSRDYASKDALEQESSERVQTANTITQSINTLKKNIEDNYSTTEEVNSKIEQKADSITQNINSFKQNVEGKLTTTETKVSNFEQNLDSITQSLTAIKDNTVENIVNGDFENGFNNWTTSYSGITEIATINNVKWLHMEIYATDVPDSVAQKLTALMKDTQYRLSFDAYTGSDDYTIRINKYSYRIL